MSTFELVIIGLAMVLGVVTVAMMVVHSNGERKLRRSIMLLIEKYQEQLAAAVEIAEVNKNLIQENQTLHRENEALHAECLDNNNLLNGFGVSLIHDPGGPRIIKIRVAEGVPSSEVTVGKTHGTYYQINHFDENNNLVVIEVIKHGAGAR